MTDTIKKFSQDTFAVETTVNLEPIRIMDLFTGAFEGGSNYWCARVRPSDEGKALLEDEDYLRHVAEIISVDPAEVASFFYLWMPLTEAGIVVHTDEGEAFRLDRSACHRGLQSMARRSPKDFALLCSEDDDANTADTYLQYCCFNEVVYG